jgi:hypothetical protein
MPTDVSVAMPGVGVPFHRRRLGELFSPAHQRSEAAPADCSDAQELACFYLHRQFS